MHHFLNSRAHGIKATVDAARRTLYALAVVCLLVASQALLPDRAEAYERRLAPIDRPGPSLSVPKSKMAAALHCTSSVKDAPRAAVLLSPGTGQTSDEAFRWNYQPALKARGIPWCALDTPDHTLADIQIQGEYFVYAIRQMYRLSGRKVSILGYSQGGMNFRWALRYWPGTRRMVDDTISLGGDNHGTETINNLGACATTCPPAAWQQIPGSEFLRALNSPVETFDGISYTQVFTNYDLLSTPAGAGGTTPLRTGQGDISNVALQDICPGNTADHAAIGSTDPVAFALAIDALGHRGPARPARIDRAVCLRSSYSGVDPSKAPTSVSGLPYLLAAATPVNLTEVEETRRPPRMRCYVYADCSRR